MKRLIFLVTLVSMSALVTAPAVLAAAPANDTYAGRTTIASLPYSNVQDTTEATTDADDQELNFICGAPATDASVWYEYTAPADGGLIIDVSGSDYSAGVLVGTGSPGSFNIMACAPETIAFPVFAGETYAILAIDDQLDGGGNGGTLQIMVDEFEVPPTPTVSLTVNTTGTFNKDGSATVSGTVTCSDGDFVDIEGFLRQKVGRQYIQGYGYTGASCSGQAEPWSMTVWADNGLFKGGQTLSATFGFSCNSFDCGSDYVEATIQLKGTGKK